MNPSSRLFLIGNGPSLTPEDLDKLTFEESWASGRIDLMYPRTGWRPTRAFWGEWVKCREDYDSLHTHLAQDYEYWIRRDAAEYLLNSWVPLDFPDRPASYWKFQFPVTYPEHVHFYDWCGSKHAGMIQDRNADIIPETWHLPELCRFGSTFHIMLQVAVLEGYKEIICIGLDLNYNEGRTGNYFDDDYQIKHWGAELADRTNRTHILAHEIALKGARYRGATILNATRGGALEVYSRVDFDSLF